MCVWHHHWPVPPELKLHRKILIVDQGLSRASPIPVVNCALSAVALRSHLRSGSTLATFSDLQLKTATVPPTKKLLLPRSNLLKSLTNPIRGEASYRGLCAGARLHNPEMCNLAHCPVHGKDSGSSLGAGRREAHTPPAPRGLWHGHAGRTGSRGLASGCKQAFLYRENRQGSWQVSFV